MDIEPVSTILNIDVSEYECCICKTYEHTLCGVIGCMHPVCRMCINKCKKIEDNIIYYECPMCRNKYNKYDINYILNRQRNNIVVKCPNECNEKVNLCDYISHLSLCSLSKVNCVMDDCPWIGYRKNTNDHLKNCSFVKLECRYCNYKFYKEAFQVHESICKEYYEIIDCKDCNKKMMKWKVKHHNCKLNNDVKYMDEYNDIFYSEDEVVEDILLMIFIEECKYGINKILKKNIEYLTYILWTIDCKENLYEDEYKNKIIKYVCKFWNSIYNRHEQLKNNYNMNILREKNKKILSIEQRCLYISTMKKVIELESKLNKI